MNVEVVPLESPLGQHRLMRSGTILIKQNRKSSVLHPVSSELHNLIQVWHGVPFKRIGYIAADFQGKLDRIASHHAQYRAVISSSKVDSLAMTAAFYPLTFHQIWNTGLPRNDFILRDEDQLPADYRTELDKLRTLVGDRRLVLFMPTFRNAQSEGYYRFSPDEIAWLDTWLHTNNCVLGVREHMADSARLYSAQLAGLPILDLSDTEFAHVEMLYRASTALITDYSSAFVDYLLTGKPTVSFAYDYESYLLERGGFYDLDFCFPGPICKNFTDLQTALDQILEPPTRVLRLPTSTVLRPRRRPQLRPRRRARSATSLRSDSEPGRASVSHEPAATIRTRSPPDDVDDQAAGAAAGVEGVTAGREARHVDPAVSGRTGGVRGGDVGCAGGGGDAGGVRRLVTINRCCRWRAARAGCWSSSPWCRRPVDGRSWWVRMIWRSSAMETVDLFVGGCGRRWGVVASALDGGPGRGGVASGVVAAVVRHARGRGQRAAADAGRGDRGGGGVR